MPRKTNRVRPWPDPSPPKVGDPLPWTELERRLAKRLEETQAELRVACARLEEYERWLQHAPRRIPK